MLTHAQRLVNDIRETPAPLRLLARVIDTPPHRVCVACGERKQAKRFRAHTRMCRACENNRKGTEVDFYADDVGATDWVCVETEGGAE